MNVEHLGTISIPREDAMIIPANSSAMRSNSRKSHQVIQVQEGANVADDDWSRRRRVVRLDPYSNLLAGSVGGAAGLFVGYPFDTVKVKLQTVNPCVVGGNTAAAPYTGTFSCLRHILVNEGGLRRGLYRGMAGSLLMSTPRFALIFQGNALGLKLLGEDERSAGPPSSYSRVFLAGAISQLAVVPLVVAPCERIKVLLQTQHPECNPTGQLACIKRVLQEQGFTRGLMRGTLLTYSRDIPSFSTYFLTYEFFRANLFARPTQESTSGVLGTGVLETLVSGALAGFCGWAVAIPFDTLKNRHQAEMSGSVLATLKGLLKTDGVTGLYRGAVPILVRSGPANAAAFLGYEVVISMLTSVR